jgi:hypothetical protein
MACRQCDCTMQSLWVDPKDKTVWWCPRCGTIKVRWRNGQEEINSPNPRPDLTGTDMEKLMDAISYTEGVDALLDGTIPARKNPKDPTSEPIWLKERVEMLLDQLESTADKLSDCWMFLDRLARLQDGSSLDIVRKSAERLLRRQQCPGWKDGEK